MVSKKVEENEGKQSHEPLVLGSVESESQTKITKKNSWFTQKQITSKTYLHYKTMLVGTPMGVVGGSHRWLGEKMIVRVWDKKNKK